MYTIDQFSAEIIRHCSTGSPDAIHGREVQTDTASAMQTIFVSPDVSKSRRQASFSPIIEVDIII